MKNIIIFEVNYQEHESLPKQTLCAFTKKSEALQYKRATLREWEYMRGGLTIDKATVYDKFRLAEHFPCKFDSKKGCNKCLKCLEE